MKRSRVTAGVPEGGQFAAENKTDSDVVLEDVEAAPSGFVTRLEYTAGTSDKFYEVTLDGDSVRIRYGRNGTFGQSDTVQKFSSELEAEKFAAKKISEKEKKGYLLISETDLDAMNLTANSTPYDNAATEIEKPIRPMLAKMVEPSDLEMYLDHEGWVTQLKYDGDRYAVACVNGKVGVIGRNGQPKKRELNPHILSHFEQFDGWVFDGEMVSSRLVLFDIIEAPGLPDDAPFDERYEMLVATISQIDSEHIDLAPVAATPEEKRAMLEQAENDRREGIMFRDRTSSYQQGRTDRLLKWKFVKEVDAVVMEVGRDGKDNVVVGLVDKKGKVVEVGQVTAIGKGDFQPGDVLEVRYLYITDEASPRLYQPRIMRKRSDKSADECTDEQLLGSVTNKTV